MCAISLNIITYDLPPLLSDKQLLDNLNLTHDPALFFAHVCGDQNLLHTSQ